MRNLYRVLASLFLACMIAPLGSKAARAQADTGTSTAGVAFPEETGVLPRAGMPEGGAEKPALNPAEKEAQKEQERESATVVAPTTMAEWRKRISMSWEGYVKVIYDQIESDPNAPFVGKNGGFRLGNARLGFTAMYDNNLHAFVSVETAADTFCTTQGTSAVCSSEDITSPNATFQPGPRDVYLGYEIARAASVRLGRFKSPYDIGFLQDEGGRIFIDAPVESRGVDATQGYELDGMRQDREMGLMIKSDRLGLTKDGIDIGYAVALTNGRTLNLTINDNNSPAVFGRLSLLYGSWVTVNFAGFIDKRTHGTAPNLFDENWKGFEASAVASFYGVRLEGQYLLQTTDFTTTGAPTVTVKGYHAQISYRIYGVEAAYRFAAYDPNDLDPVRKVNEHTFGLSYYFQTYPLRFTVNGTLAGEEPERRLKNNRIAAMVQFNF